MDHRSVVILVASSVLVACGGAPFEPGPLQEAVVSPEGGSSEASAPEADAPDASDPPDTGCQRLPDGVCCGVPGVAPCPVDAGEPDADARDAGADVSDADADAGPACVTDLSGVGAGDFTIAFTLTTSETGLTLALLNQRTGCDTQSPFWDVWLGPAGGVTAATDQNAPSNYVFVEGGNSLNDGQPHDVQIIRRGGQLWYTSDGAAHSAMVSDPDNFGALAPLTIGSSACTGHDPAAGHATITDVCITMP